MPIRGKLAHDAGSFCFAYGTAIELVGCGSTDETNLHDCHFVWTCTGNDKRVIVDQTDQLSCMSVLRFPCKSAGPSQDFRLGWSTAE